MVFYWLVLVYTFATGTNAATSNMLHVGNFKSKESCQAAGNAAIQGHRDFVFVCVQANETGVFHP